MARDRKTADEARREWPRGLAILAGIAAMAAGITVFGTSKRSGPFKVVTFMGVILVVLAMVSPVFGAAPENTAAT